jgi:hypothetical protein
MCISKMLKLFMSKLSSCLAHDQVVLLMIKLFHDQVVHLIRLPEFPLLESEKRKGLPRRESPEKKSKSCSFLKGTPKIKRACQILGISIFLFYNY